MWTRRQFLGRSCTGVAAAALGVSEAPAFQASQIQSNPEPERLSPADAARGVLERQLGKRAAEFHLRSISYSSDGHEAYQLRAQGGTVEVAGTSAVAICRGVYSYLRDRCGAMITWSGSHLDLPARLPDQEKIEVACPYRYVQYLNPCTYGYTMAFWDWSRWERELDWMALHGINMPLAMEGQEYVWQKVWASFGLSQAEIDAFGTGPAQLPWHRMGNINRFDGPLSQHWIEQHKLLQRKILDRMRSLGMKPVAPAFAGFVPQGFLRVHPEAETFTLLWLPKEFATIPRDTRTFILHPRQEELYREIGRRFIETYKQTYGEVQYYLADTFNELAVPVTEDHRYEDLEQFGKTVYSGIRAGDPNGTWVMQGWLFVFDPFWDPASVEALLRGVPDDRMLILDYSNDLTPGLRDKYAPSPWKRFHAFYGKQWANGMAHTFGGNNNVKGNLALMASEPAAVLASQEKGNLVGWSMCPEGIETNEVVYELMTDASWRQEPINLDTWIPAYCTSRYGACPPAMREAWQLLLKSAYGAHIWMTKQAWQGEPSLSPTAASVDSGEDYKKAVTLFLSCASQLGDAPLYRNDLIEFVGQAAGGFADAQLAEATQAIRGKELSTAKYHAAAALKMLDRIDALTNLRADRRLETWVGAARVNAATPDEAALLDENARRLITTWGWPELSDYASRVWSGLIRDYYAARWRVWFDHQFSGSDFSLDIWQQSWLSRPYTPSAPVPVPDLIAEAQSMMETIR
ncbi:alpha-N-acetylglucosaminidase [Silvibacterium acidisoli]|uniref:alpha-N-acetylglucosaminidase n=1 Tax=Acidobacteriaceae bacterium ZG23-2 TaxID=2883246 RepID=UPI00406C7EFB